MMNWYQGSLIMQNEVRERVRQAERDRLADSVRPRRQGLISRALHNLPRLIGHLPPNVGWEPQAREIETALTARPNTAA